MTSTWRATWCRAWTCGSTRRAARIEASGTSGQKAAINGVLNCSVLDGWWREGYNGKNGWAIGDEEEYPERRKSRTRPTAKSLYEVLENEIIPLYYDRDDNYIPRGWLRRVKESIRTLAPHLQHAAHGQRVHARDVRPGGDVRLKISNPQPPKEGTR